jgi:DNA-binding LytR/AlgR family response regulator
MNVSPADAAAVESPQPRDWLLLAVLAVVFLLAMVIGGRAATDTEIFWRAERAMLDGSDISLVDLGALDDVAMLRIDVDLQDADLPDQPIALYLSGPFSADVAWDGQPLGNKGQAGETRELEVPGPIDTTLYIPEGWAGPGQHTLELHLSSFHAGYEPGGIIHRVALGGFRADPRRELRYYAWPLLLSGGFGLIGIFFARIYLESGALRAMLSVVMSGFLLLQLAAEVSRSFVAYEYQWHLLRSFTIWLAAIGWGVSWQWAAWSRTREGGHRWLLVVTVAAALLVSWYAAGFDNKTVGAIGVLASMPLAAAIHRVVRARPDVILLCDGALAVALIAMVLVAPGMLLDRVIYMLLSVHLSITWFLLYAGNERVEAATATSLQEDYFSVKLAGRQVRIATDDVVYLHAEGNFCELHGKDGKMHLHQHRLGQIMRSPPPGFVRVQRSYAINTRYLNSLQSLEGSRYRAILATGDEVPVSRYLVAELRELMGTH